MLGVEAGIAPGRSQFGVAHVLADGAVGQVDGGAVVRTSVGSGIRLQPIGAGDVEDLLVPVAALDPALDDLEALERGAGRVAQRADRESGTAASIAVDLASHGDAALVADRRHVVTAVKVIGQAVAGEHPHPDASPRGGEGLLAAQSLVDGLPRVLVGPDAGQARVAVVAAEDLAIRRHAIDDVGRDRAPADRVEVVHADLAGVLLLVELKARVVGVAGADEPQPIRVEALPALKRDALQQRLADVAAPGSALRPLADAKGEDLEVGPLVVGRQEGMGFGGALDLRDLDERLVAHPLRRVVDVEGTARERLGLEHPAVRAVRVVRDRQRLDALVTQAIHPAPKVLGIRRIESAEGLPGCCAAPEDHVPVQVAAVSRGGVLVADKGRQGARPVVAFRGGDDLLPRRSDDFGIRVQGNELLGARQVASSRLDRRRVDVALDFGIVRQRVAGVGEGAQDPEVRRVVRHCVEVEGPVELDLVARGMPDRLPGSEAVRVVGCRPRGEREGIERVRGVHVQVAEVRRALLSSGRRERRDGLESRQGRREQESRRSHGGLRFSRFRGVRRVAARPGLAHPVS